MRVNMRWDALARHVVIHSALIEVPELGQNGRFLFLFNTFTDKLAHEALII